MLKTSVTKPLLLGIAIAAFAVGAASAQGIKRTPLQDIKYPAGHHIVTVVAEIGPNQLAGRHTHPGVDTGYVLDGEATLIIEGQPDKALKAGDSYAVPAGIPHDVKTGAKGLKLLAIYVVEDGKPVATPAPK
ncbi:cupin domain-containing protein [Rhodopseudomonas boonkerdii]|uniref:cupin domain-containing protein n=1 Tax=Rhodopseudomonas boonkerdii TaxID=475937 RepID=UPI001E545C53|nr:cupin domain-containing protein [Rhodopseudomonas boonkerdii]UGV26035.1 cupin domain-containing protein [Rhodopseudomonas boonkerdii]